MSVVRPIQPVKLTAALGLLAACALLLITTQPAPAAFDGLRAAGCADPDDGPATAPTPQSPAEPPRITAVSVDPASGVTSVRLGVGLSLHLRPTPTSPAPLPQPQGPAADAAPRVVVRAFIPYQLGRSGPEIGMLAAAMLDPDGLVREGPPPHGALRTWMGHDGLHVRLAGPGTEVASLLGRVAEALRPDPFDPQLFEAVRARLIKRLAGEDVPGREVTSRMLRALNPAYHRPDPDVLLTISPAEVIRWQERFIAPISDNLGPRDGGPAPQLPPLSIGISGTFELAAVIAAAPAALRGLQRGPIDDTSFDQSSTTPSATTPSATTPSPAAPQPARPPVRPVELVSGISLEPDRGYAVLVWEGPPTSHLAGYRPTLAAARLIQARLTPKVQQLDPSAIVTCTVMPGPARLPSSVAIIVRSGPDQAIPEQAATLAAEAITELAQPAGPDGASISEKELSTVLGALERDSKRFIDSSDYWASVLATCESSGINPAELVRAPLAYRALTADSLRQAAASWLQRGQKLRMVQLPTSAK